MFISLFSLTLPVLFDIFHFIRFVLFEKPDSEISTICLEFLSFFSIGYVFSHFFFPQRRKFCYF